MMNMKITFSISYVRITVDTAYEDDHQVKMDDDLQKNFLSAIGDPSKGNLKPFRYLLIAQVLKQIEKTYQQGFSFCN